MLLQGLKHYADADVAFKLWWRCNYTNYSNMYVIVSVGHVFPQCTNCYQASDDGNSPYGMYMLYTQYVCNKIMVTCKTVIIVNILPPM